MSGYGPSAKHTTRALRLTPRETELLKLASEGKTSREIADILGVKRETVSKALKTARDKAESLT